MPQMIPVDSSWVLAYGWENDTLYVRYHDKQGNATVTCRYDGVSEAMWQDFQAAPSYGRWVHANIIHRPYVIVG